MILVTLKREWEMLDFSSDPPKKVVVPAGEHELERIDNPYHPGVKCLVLKGTRTGMAENAWRQWINGVISNVPGHPNHGKPIDWKDFEIILEEDGVLVPPPTK